MNNKNLMPVCVVLFSVFSILACKKTDLTTNVDTKDEMRNFVIGISKYAKSKNPSFLIIPQNGVELVTMNGEDDGAPHLDYLNAIDANGQEDLFYGYVSDNEVTPTVESNYLQSFLDISKQAGNTILVTNYCSTPAKMDNGYTQNDLKGYISFSSDNRELSNIPEYPFPIFNENLNDINSLSEVQNFLYLINPESYSTKVAFINAITSTNYDLLIMDLFFHDGNVFTESEIEQLRAKADGDTRLLVSYMSIGEAEDYRYYWRPEWSTNKPNWLDEVNPNWPGNYKVKYWAQEWQFLIYGNDDSYLKKIIDVGFDGVYLDIIDAFEYYE